MEEHGSVWSAKVLFSFHIFKKLKAKKDFSTPNASRLTYLDSL